MNSVLQNLLIREHLAIGVFLELLDQEAEAMTHGDFAKLPGLAARKSQQADEIAYMGLQRETEQLALGFVTGRSGAAAAAASDEALQNAWRDLLNLAAQAHECNHRNGVMIHTHLEFTRQSISFLQASGKPLYGPDGTHKTGASSGNSLALG